MPQERNFDKFPADRFPPHNNELYTGAELKEWFQWAKGNVPEPSNSKQDKLEDGRKRAASNSNPNQAPAKKGSKAKAKTETKSKPSTATANVVLNHYPGKVKEEDYLAVSY
jgi:hypothetical protein